MKKIIFVFIVLIFCFEKKINAQDEEISILDYDYSNTRVSIVFTPTAYLHPRMPATQLGVEVSTGRYFSFVQEGGFIYSDNNRRSNQKGYRIRSEFRVFPFKYTVDDINLYLGLQFRHWKYKLDGEDDFCRFNCLYQQELEYQAENRGTGWTITGGFVVDIDFQWKIEFGGGIGQANIKNTPTDLPEDAELPFQDFVFGFNRSHAETYEESIPVILFWIKAGYTF